MSDLECERKLVNSLIVSFKLNFEFFSHLFSWSILDDAQSLMMHGQSFGTYAKSFEKLTFPTCAYQGARNVSFAENFAHALDLYFLTEE